MGVSLSFLGVSGDMRGGLPSLTHLTPRPGHKGKGMKGRRSDGLEGL